MTWGVALGEFGATIMFAGISPDAHKRCRHHSGMESNLESALALLSILVIVSLGIPFAIRGG